MSAGTGIAENGTLPTAGNQAYDKATVSPKYIYGRIQISGPVIAATKSNVGSFVRAIDSEIKGCTTDFKRALNRQLMSDGRDALGFWTSGDDTSGTVIDDGNGFAYTPLPVGQAITCDLIATSDNSTKHGTAIVVTLGSEASSPTGFNVTWTGTVASSADGDYLVLANTLGNQLMGIEGIINNGNPPLGNLQGIDATSKTFWQAQVIGDDTNKVDLSFPLMQKVISKIASNSDAEEKDIAFLLASYQMRDKYVELCVNERKYYNTMTLDGGFEAVEYNGKPLVPDPQCKHGRIYFVVPSSMKLLKMAEVDWMNKDGAVLSRVLNTDAYEATLFMYANLATVARNRNGVLQGINE